MSLSTTTSLAVLSTDTVAQDDLLLVDKGLGTEAQRTAGVIGTGSTVNTHDIFGDGSAVATYQLNGDATDLGGNYDGTATDVTYDDGKFGQAGVFDDISLSRIITPSLSSIKAISLWIKKDYLSDLSVNKYIFDFRASGDAAIWLYKNTIKYSAPSGTIYKLIENKIEKNVISSGGDNMLTNQWVHLYVEFINTQTSTVTLGDYNQTDGNYSLDGSINQVRIFNRALTASEVSRLYTEEYKTVAISPALSAIPTTSETVSSYLPYTNDSYFNKPIDASSADFTETSTTTTAVYAVGDIIKDTSTNKLYKCTVINTVGILLTDNAYFTGLSTLSVTSGVFTYTDGKNDYGYNRKSDTFTGSVDFSGATDGIKYVAKDLNANIFNFLDGKPNIGLYDKTSADDNRYVFDTESGKWYTTTGGELVSGGTFNAQADVDLWTITNDNLKTLVNGTMEVNRNSGSADGVYLAVSGFEVGTTYKISVSVTSVTSDARAHIRVGKTNLSSEYLYVYLAADETGLINSSFVADSQSVFINLSVGNSTTGVIGFDNISVYKKQPTLDTLITTPMSFMKNPIMCQNGIPQYLVKQLANRRRRS